MLANGDKRQRKKTRQSWPKAFALAVFKMFLRQPRKRLSQRVLFHAGVTVKVHCAFFATRGGGKTQPVAAHSGSKTFAIIFGDQHQTGQAGQHDCAIGKLRATGNRPVGAGFGFAPAFAAIGTEIGIAAHAPNQNVAILQAHAAPKRAFIRRGQRGEISAAIDRFIDFQIQPE